jgi:hypothetical protein
VQHNVLEIGIAVMPVCTPVAGVQINFHVARTRRVLADLDYRPRKIRSPLGIGETRMENSNSFSVRGFEPVPTQALMEPDGLKQALGGEVVFVAQGIHGAGARAPAGIEVPGRRRHLEIAFAPAMAQSQVSAQKKSNASYAGFACL